MAVKLRNSDNTIPAWSEDCRCECCVERLKVIEHLTGSQDAEVTQDAEVPTAEAESIEVQVDVVGGKDPYRLTVKKFPALTLISPEVFGKVGFMTQEDGGTCRIKVSNGWAIYKFVRVEGENLVYRRAVYSPMELGL